jgi:hypothetical protein
MKQSVRPFVVEIKRNRKFSAKIEAGLHNSSNGKGDHRYQGEDGVVSPRGSKGEELLSSRDILRLPNVLEKRLVKDQ